MRNQAEMVVAATIKDGDGRGEIERRRKECKHESKNKSSIWFGHCECGNISEVGSKKRSKNDTGSKST